MPFLVMKGHSMIGSLTGFFVSVAAMGLLVAACLKWQAATDRGRAKRAANVRIGFIIFLLLGLIAIGFGSLFLLQQLDGLARDRLAHPA
jgi:uncharacterized protein YqgC (DUF456 family)